jgi:small nuclear ribonucleoprotein F
MNIQLSNTEEFIDRKFTGALGQVLIRCNNVLYVTAADGKGGEGDRDTKMEG